MNKKPTWYKPTSEMGVSVVDKDKNDGGSQMDFFVWHQISSTSQATAKPKCVDC